MISDDSGLMFPKPGKKKKRKKHKQSIMHCKDGTCYLCMKLHGNYRTYPVVHKHHVYPGTRKNTSEGEGFVVYLCPAHDTCGPESVHHKPENLELIQKECQRVFERTHTRQQFIEIIGRSYLED